MELYKKYRPVNLKQFFGNENTVNEISSYLEDIESLPHAMLITGPTGCGKTTLGRIIASHLCDMEYDYAEIDSADFRGIDTVRELRKQSQYKPYSSNHKVYLIDECHKMTNDAQNALLKALEDPPSHVYYILCTTDPQKLINTVKGRCQRFTVNTLTEKQIYKLIYVIAKKEGYTLDKEVIQQISRDSLGHSRNAIVVLDKVLRVDEDKRLEVAKEKAKEENEIIELCRALLNGATWKKTSAILKGLEKQDPETIRRTVIAYCSSVLLKSDNERAAAIIETFWEPTYNIGFPGVVYMSYACVK